MPGGRSYFNVLSAVLCIPALLDSADPGYDLLGRHSDAFVW